MLAGVLLAPVPAAAGDHDRGAPEAVRRAVEAGEIKSLADILASLRGKLPGQIAGVEIERERGRWIYEFRVVDDKGRLYEAYVDARSGEIERIKEK
ncbi:PepSY domain-containing protein [Bradyrhizobium sp. CCBAU 53415]|uniref:PepSY domain-containing protein n=1 Tax=Bradyrhizobium sp. CCBAU 53415 TaxID=1325119 RepID=UPI00230557F8|nr:PepSY domain-containing protein [Bradyrhizobium sp. CCBAU 53415]